MAVFILSFILPKKLFPNWLCMLMDAVSIGAGDVIRKQRFYGFLLFFLSVFVLAVLRVMEDRIIQSLTFKFHADDVSFYFIIAAVLIGFFYVLYRGADRAGEIHTEYLERSKQDYINSMNKIIKKFEERTGMSFGPVRWIASSNSTGRSRDSYSNYKREQERKEREDIEFDDEVRDTIWRQNEIDRQIEHNRQIEEVDRHFHDGF